MKKLFLLAVFLIIGMASFSQNAEDDGYVIGFAPSDSVYMDFKVERTEYNDWHKIGTILNELYGLEPKELSEATVICDKKFKVYEGWKNVSEIDLANPQSTIAGGKDKYIVQVRYRKGGSEDFADQSSSTTSNVIIFNVETVKDGVGEKMVTVCYPSSKYEFEVAGDLSAERVFGLPIHEYPIFVNIYGIPRGFDAAKNLHDLDVHWDALYMNKAMYEYFRKKGASITPQEKTMFVKAAYNAGRGYAKMGIYHRALPYLAFVSRNSAGEKYAVTCDIALADCLDKLNEDNSDVYDKIILAYQANPKMDARDLDCVIKACIARGEIYAFQKNVEKAKECYQKATAIDTAKRYASKIAECMEKLNKLSN
ncbi:MAG: tetratricopeptide repeat protein [Bacteroidales bacterium]|nr:tetratricopeptide repeat protein [Bacteroidales bacterium]